MGDKGREEYHRNWYLKNKDRILKKMERIRELDPEKFKKQRDLYYYKNRDKCVKRSGEWSKNNKEWVRNYRKQRDEELKKEVLSHYGNGRIECVLCGFKDIRALSLDHINNDGAKQRKTMGTGGKFYSRLKGKGYPCGFRTICMNCQWIEREKFRAGRCWRDIGK